MCDCFEIQRGAPVMERVLKEQELLKTAVKLQERVAERFPESGLSKVAAEVVLVTREALVRAERIRRPDLVLRGGLIVLLVVVLAGVAWELWNYWYQVLDFQSVFSFFGTTKEGAAYAAAIALFLVTLEVRLKRRRALKAIHELRAMAHIIDMHQLAKDPDRIGLQDGPVEVAGKVMTAESIGRYLHYSTELLALVSKVGALYVQDFPDATALTAVDQFENLATGLSSKIWQKIMILDRIQAERQATGQATTPATGLRLEEEKRGAAKGPALPAH
jgi:hypothetical protein